MLGLVVHKGQLAELLLFGGEFVEGLLEGGLGEGKGGLEGGLGLLVLGL